MYSQIEEKASLTDLMPVMKITIRLIWVSDYFIM